MKRRQPFTGAMTTAIVACLSFVFAADRARAEAPAATPLDVQTIVAKSIEASGGRAKLEAIKTIEVSGTVSIPAQGLEGTYTVQKKPDAAVMQMELPNIGVIRMGWGDDVVYEQSDLTGSRILAGNERQQMLRSLDPKTQFSRLEALTDLKVEGAEAIDGAATWKLVGKSETGTDETTWVDQKTYLPLRIAMTVTTQMGAIKAVVSLKDYKTFDGLPVPMTSEQEAAGSKMVMKIVDVKLNPELPDAAFALPDDVKKLAARKAAAKPTTSPAVQP